jgi:hypothetical protein
MDKALSMPKLEIDQVIVFNVDTVSGEGEEWRRDVRF